MRSIFLLLFCTFNLYSQDIAVDRNGSDVFSFFATNKPQLSLVSGDNSLRINFTYSLSEIPWQTVSGNETVKTHYGLSMTGKIFSSDNVFFLDNINRLKPAYQINVGFQKTFEDLNLNNIPVPVSAWGVQYYYRKDNIMIFDTISNIEARQKPDTHGILIHYSFFSNPIIQLSLSALLESTWNKKDLIDYQYSSGLLQNNQITSVGTTVGKIGPYTRATNFRFRVSTPITPFSYLDNGLARLCVIPYYSVLETTNGTNNKLLGFTLNYLGKGATLQEYTFTEGFGLGIDWLNNSKEQNQARVFIFGTIKFGK